VIKGGMYQEGWETLFYKIVILKIIFFHLSFDWTQPLRAWE